ncbi:MAG: hypothetical protein JKX81_07865, partial [Arenicella sp.]|nr:hypothetical protein [Arenicella sp.]
MQNTRSYRKKFSRDLIFLLALVLSQSVSLAANIEVTATIGGFGCDLIEAISSANNNASEGGCVAQGSYGADTILLPPEISVHTLTTVNIDSLGATGLPHIISHITIEGEGANAARIERADTPGTPKFRIFQVRSGGSLTLKNIRIAGGDVDGRGGGLYVVSGGELILSNCTVIDNRADTGGGIANQDSSILISDSAVLNNHAFEPGSGTGGGIDIRSVSGSASATVIDSTISANTARIGAGISINGEDSSTSVINSTISDNHASANSGGGGIGINDFVAGMIVSVRNTVISGNTHPVIFGGQEIHRFGSASDLNFEHNLIGHSGLSTVQAVSDGLLAESNLLATADGNVPTALLGVVLPLADNGGPTLTHALPKSSPAIDAATDGEVVQV